jgi:hypothetical protein
MISYILSTHNLTIVINSKVFVVAKTHSEWNKIMEALREKNEEKLIFLISPPTAIVEYTNGRITIKNRKLYYKNYAGSDYEISNYISQKILEFYDNKFPVDPMIRFIERLMLNTSKRAIDGLYQFLEHKNLPITPDGTFLAYKGISNDNYSKTSGKLRLLKGKTLQDGEKYRIFNGIGEEIEADRNEICDDPNVHCSGGLHVGSMKYALEFAGGDGKVVILEVDPKNVVCVPNDAQCQKLRVCKYKVLADYSGPLPNAYISSQTDNTSQYKTVADLFDDSKRNAAYTEREEKNTPTDIDYMEEFVNALGGRNNDV